MQSAASCRKERGGGREGGAATCCVCLMRSTLFLLHTPTPVQAQGVEQQACAYACADSGARYRSVAEALIITYPGANLGIVSMYHIYRELGRGCVASEQR